MLTNSLQDNKDLSVFSKNSNLFIVWGLALILLGVVAMSATVLTTLVTVFLLGMIIFISGIVVGIDAFTFWRGTGKGFLLHLLMSVIYLAAGLMLMKNPIAGSISITFILGVVYVILGLFRLTYALSMRMMQWGWSLFNGMITLLLGILILANWPASSLFIIGLFVGIDLIFCGWAYVMVAMAAKNQNK